MAENLMHFGIPGMKWGRRKARVSTTPSSDHTTARGLQKKNLSELSNDELKTLTSRLQLEKQYKDLTKKEVSAGKKFVADVLQSSGKTIASKFVVDTFNSINVGAIRDLLNKS
jgi:hypothetical protein